MDKLTLSAMIFLNGGKVHPLSFKKILKGVQQRYYGLSSNLFNKTTVTELPSKIPSSVNDSELEKEQACLQPVPKKQYGLSKVEEKDLELVESLKIGNIFYPYKTPYERCWKILTEDMKCGLRKVVYNLTGVKLGPFELVYFPRYTDILIVGGGILGLTIAYTLKERFPHGPAVFVVDKDPNFPPISTNLTQAMVTHQLFAHEDEIPILKYGSEFFSSFSRNTQVEGCPPFKLPYEPLGSLVLIDNSNIEQALEKIEALKRYEINNKILDADTLKSKFPWLNTNNIMFGSLGMSNEGLVDPWAYIYGLKAKCINLGVTFLTAEVVDFGFSGQGTNVPLRVICKLPDGTYNSIDFSKCILACGMEALNITEILNSSEHTNLVVKLPLQERLKFEYCFYNPDGPGLDTPIVIDSSGTYFRREGLGGHYVAGVSSVSSSNDDEKDPYHMYHSRVKPFLEERVPAFKNLQLVSGWVDVQEHCFSNDAGILGCHPEAHNILYALGFSNLGLQYIPGVARAAMEELLYDDNETIDFTPFRVENLWRRQHLEADRKRRELLESKQRIAISK